MDDDAEPDRPGGEPSTPTDIAEAQSDSTLWAELTTARNLENLTKYSAAAALLCFLGGWLVQSTYLFKLGFSVGDLSALRARLVVVGAMFIATLAMSFAGVLGAGHAAAKRVTGTSTSSWFGDFLLGLGGLAMPYFLFVFLLGSRLDEATAILALEGWAWSSAGALAIVGFAYFLFRLSDRTPALTLWAVVFTASYFIFYLNFYAGSVYPLTPQEFGGAKPVRAWVSVADQTTASTLARSGIGFDQDSLRSVALDELYEDDDIIVVRNDDGHVIRIQRRTVIAVQSDNRGCVPLGVSTKNMGTKVGVPQEGDVIAFEFSEEVAPRSVLDGWDGSPTAIVARSRTQDYGEDKRAVEFSFFKGDGDPLALGDLAGFVNRTPDRTAREATYGDTGTPSVMTQRGRTIEVQLGTPSSPWLDGPMDAGVSRWMITTGMQDLAGLACELTAITKDDPTAPAQALF